MEKIGISDIMVRDIVSVPYNASIRETAEVLQEGICCVAVKKGKEIVGVVTDRDFVKLALLAALI
jgi:CBS-domain-containing membrane protein